MSLCALSWKSTKRLGRAMDMALVHASAHHGGHVVAVDSWGGTWEIERVGRVPRSWTKVDDPTTTARLVSGLRAGRRSSDEPETEWEAEVVRRLRELVSVG